MWGRRGRNMEIWQVLSAVFTGLAVGLIGLALARLPRSAIAPPLYGHVAAGGLWAIGNLIANTATTMGWKEAGVAILYTGAIALPSFWWAVALRWAEEEGARLPFRGAAWRNVPYAFAAAMWLVMITNPWHGAFLTPVVRGHNLYQPFWFVMAVPNYALILGALAVELAVMVRVRSREVRRQGALLITASLVTLAGNLLYVFGQVPFDPTSVVLSASGALLALGMAREGLFGVVPTALLDVAARHPDGLVVTGPDGRVRYTNPRSRSLLAPIDVLRGAPLLELLRDSRLRTDPPDTNGQPAEAPWMTWVMLTRPSGVTLLLDGAPPRWLHLSAKAVYGRRGWKGHCIRISDQTAQKDAERRERQARRLESVADLARTISRQFQGTFELVHNNASMLLADPDTDAASERKLARIVEAAVHGSNLASELQLYTGSVTTQRVVLELSEIVEECCQLVEGDVPAGVRVVFTRSEEPLPVDVDAIQLRHCVFSVLMNAIDAMAQASGEIRVSLGRGWLDPAGARLVWGADQPVGDYAYVRVRDEGGGMDRETEERAFEPFLSKRPEDRGADLPTALGIARAHHAPVALENEHGRGCEVTIYFPLDRADPRNGVPERRGFPG